MSEKFASTHGIRTGGYKTVTVADVIDAMEKNGYPQLKGQWVAKDANGNLAGCAMGQAAINLGVSWSVLNDKLVGVSQKRKDLSHLGQRIMYLNDRRGKTIPEIVADIRERFSGALEQEMTLPVMKY